MRAGELTLPPATALGGRPSWNRAEELALVPWWSGCRRAGRLTNLAKAQEQGFELDYPHIYIICELFEFMKGPVLLIQSCKISMSETGNRDESQ